MRKIMLATALLCAVSTLSAALTPNQEYYIWLNIYEKLIASNADGTAPALSAYGTNADADNYIFVAEDAGKSGYVLLRQKSSGKYLAASAANSYSIVFEEKRATDDRYCWNVDEGTYVYLINKKSGKYLGVDGAQSGADYVSAYYDKPKGSHSQFTAIPVAGSNWDEARQAYESDVYTNAQGVQEIDYCQLKGKAIDRDDAIDIHITANSTPIQAGTTINLGSDHTWLILDNIVPSSASSYLKYVKINKRNASVGTNCRLAIYLNGTAIIPTTGKKVMTCQGTNGEFTLNEGNSTSLSLNSNTMTSFVLRRGYMATLATDQGGLGYSRVFVADHADLEVTLPEALAKRVSSVNIKPWQYLSKKGWGDTGGATKGPSLRASWFWSWSAGYSSTADMEFVPCRQHKSWPSKNEVNNKTASAAFSINEPEHSEQHTSDKCSCGGTVDSWYCTTITPDFLEGGGRIGSPQPTDFSWMYDYFGHADDMAYRCDFAVTHAYWNISSRSEADYATWFTNHCKEVWTNTGRPLWITELEIGSSWGEKVSSYETYRKYLQVLLQKMEECDWIERYAIYEYDVYTSYMYYRDDKWNRTSLTPAGQVYRDHRSTFAYHANYTKVPGWWAPSAKKPSLEVSQHPVNGKFTFTITNPNTDMTDELYVERLMPDGTWQEVARQENRFLFDNESIKIANIEIEGATAEGDQFRATVKTHKGVVIRSDAGYITNAEIQANSKTNVDSWTMTRDASNGYTKATGDTYFEVWDATAANINFNYYQDLTALPAGIYRLTAQVFNSTDDVADAEVNGAVGLYAQTGNQLYFTPVTENTPLASAATTLDDVAKCHINRIIVQDDGKLRVGIRNLGTMQARWAGADNFMLQRIGDLPETGIEQELTRADIELYHLMPETTEGRDATRFIVNPDGNRKTSYGWTVSNTDMKTDAESFNSVASNSYWNIWKSGAFNSSMSQEITGLPAGTYTFSALLRGQDTAKMTLTAKTETATATAAFTGEGDKSATTDEFPNGWRRVTTTPITLQRGEALTISLQVATSATAWWSADHFALTLTEMSEEAVGVRSLNASTADRAPMSIYNLAGQKVAYPALKAGVYIINGKKVLLK